jgi:hypothetical protein
VAFDFCRKTLFHQNEIAFNENIGPIMFNTMIYLISERKKAEEDFVSFGNTENLLKSMESILKIWNPYVF